MTLTTISEKPRQFEIGKPDYPLEHQGEIVGARIAGEKRRDLPLTLVDMPQMERLREQNPFLRAVPVYVAFDRAKQRLWVHPSPAGEYAFEVDLGPEDVATFGRPPAELPALKPGEIRVGQPSVALPPGTVQEYAGTITKPMLRRGK